jgi:hypothetical protein
MTERRAFAVVATALLAGVLALAAGGRAVPRAPADIRLTWSDDPKTTQTIGWRSDSTVTSGQVQYARLGQPYTTVSAPPPETLATNIGAINLFSLTLRNLQPGTKYRYRAGDGANWSADYTFETEPAAPRAFKFLVFGDSHEKKPIYEAWRRTVRQAHLQNPDAKFVMNVGDLIYAGRDYEQWQAWFAACQPVIAAVPDMPAIGDHEPRGVTSDEQWQRPDYFVRLFRVPQNGPDRYKGEVYSFDYGAAHIVVLNSSFTYEFADQADREAMMKAEAAWLDADLASTTRRWKIVVYHDATYGLSPDRAGTLTKMHFAPVIDKHHVDVVFNGHEHGMARSYFIRNEEFVADAAHGTVYFVSGRTGDNAKDALGRKIWHPFFYDPQAHTCYLAVEVAAHALTVTTRLDDGTVVDRFVIDELKPEQSTPVVPFGAYKSVRLAVFGSLLPYGNPPVQNDAGEWFVDVNALATSMGGRFDASTKVLSYNGDKIQIALADEAFLDASRKMVSLRGLTGQGFYCRHHKAMNMVMVERWRD